MALLFAWAPRLTFMNDPVRAMSAGGGRVDRQPRAAARAARAGRQPAGGVVHAADRRRAADAQPDAAVRRRSGLRSRERAQPAGARTSASRPARTARRSSARRARARQGGSVGEERRDGVGGAAGGIVPAAARIPHRRRRRRRDQLGPAHRDARRQQLVLRDDRHAAEGGPYVPADRHARRRRRS